jgi:hypothetical protein
MQVLVEPTENGVRVKSASPFSVVMEGATEEEAIRRLKSVVAERLQRGARLKNVAISGPTDAANDPWQPLFGMFREDSSFDAWQQAIVENRRCKEASEGPW